LAKNRDFYTQLQHNTPVKDVSEMSSAFSNGFSSRIIWRWQNFCDIFSCFHRLWECDRQTDGQTFDGIVSDRRASRSKPTSMRNVPVFTV